MCRIFNVSSSSTICSNDNIDRKGIRVGIAGFEKANQAYMFKQIVENNYFYSLEFEYDIMNFLLVPAFNMTKTLINDSLNEKLSSYISLKIGIFFSFFVILIITDIIITVKVISKKNFQISRLIKLIESIPVTFASKWPLLSDLLVKRNEKK